MLEQPLASAPPLRVLVAEDNAFNSQLLQQLLTSRGHVVRVARNGCDALEYARGGVFDLLLLDLHMPELDGFEVIHALREHESANGGHLPTIALTARARAEDRARCFSAGVDDFLAKPIRATALWSAIERATAKADASRAHDGPLVSPRILLATCGRNPALLDVMREALGARLPEDLSKIERALADRDSNGLRESAHVICEMLAAFSDRAGAIASALEDAAMTGDLDGAAKLASHLRDLAPTLLRAIGAATIESLTSDAARA
jgi:CheY-like chemotaxis protein/HPt (histidine-containing phosphotransfer) domain-containing protein